MSEDTWDHVANLINVLAGVVIPYTRTYDPETQKLATETLHEVLIYTRDSFKDADE